MTSIHSQEEIHKERSTAPTAKVQQPVADPQVDIFSKTIKWKKLAPLPVRCAGHTAVLLGDHIYVGGGNYESIRIWSLYERCVSSYRIDVYNLTTNQWSPSPITTPHCLFAMTVLDDKLVIAGGRRENIFSGETVKKVLVLNAGQWEDYSEMPTARHSATAVGYHSMLIVIGGTTELNGMWTTTSTIEILNTTNGCWYTHALPSLLQKTCVWSGMSRPVVMNDKLYLLGGQGDDGDSTRVFVASLDTLSTNQLNWQSAPNIPLLGIIPIVMYNKFLTVSTLPNLNPTSDRAREVNVFNPSTGQCQRLTNIPAENYGPALVAVADGIVMMGGFIDRRYSNKVWIVEFK